MGAYKFYNPTTQEWEIIKSKSIIKDDGSLEYTPDQIKVIDDTVSVLTALPTTTGTANTYLATISGLSSLPLGLKITVKFHLANTGASTININGLGAKSITKAGGSALTSGTVKVNGVYTLVYDGTSFQLQGEGGEYGTALASDVLSGKTIGTDNGLVEGTIPIKGAATYTPSTSTQTIASGQYLSGTQTISAVSGLSASNVKSGAVVGGVTGTFSNTTAGATADQILSGRVGFVNGAQVTGTIPSKAAATYTPGTSAQTIASGQYLSGTQTISGVSVPVRNVLTGTTIAGQTGTMPNRGAPAQTLTTQGGQYNLPSGYYSGGSVKAQFANLTAGNIKAGVNIGGVMGTLGSLGGLSASGVVKSSGVYVTKPFAFFNIYTGKLQTSSNSNYIEITNNLGFIPSVVYLVAHSESSVGFPFCTMIYIKDAKFLKLQNGTMVEGSSVIAIKPGSRAASSDVLFYPVSSDSVIISSTKLLFPFSATANYSVDFHWYAFA